VSQGGTKTFVLKLHNSRRAIGRYPTVSLSEARTEAKRTLAEKTLGRVRPLSITVKQALKFFIEDKKLRRRARTVQSYEYDLNKHFSLPGLLEDVTFAEMLRRLERIKSATNYNHAYATGRTFFNWCLKRRYITESPLTGLSPRAIPSRSRVLTDDELKAVWIASDQCCTFGAIVKLLILTGQRRGEVSAFRTNFFSKDLCTIPASLAKNGREHTFPIGAIVTSMLSCAISSDRHRPSTLLFPARGKANSPFNGWSKGKAQLDKLSASRPAADFCYEPCRNRGCPARHREITQPRYRYNFRLSGYL
jgi:integrase